MVGVYRITFAVKFVFIAENFYPLFTEYILVNIYGNRIN
jgi:hypothetical protein